MPFVASKRCFSRMRRPLYLYQTYRLPPFPFHALVEVVVNRQELPMPPTIQLDQAMGFSLYMIKAVLDGRGTEVLDLAKTNLRR